MTQFLLSLLIIFLLTACLVNGGSSNPSVCDKLPTGLARLFYGIDITTLDLLPFDLSQPTGYKGVVLDMTCDQKKKWESTFNGELYDIPDQVAFLEILPGGWMNSIAKIYKSTADVKDMMSSKTGLKMGEGFFSGSSSYTKMRDVLSNSSTRISEITTFVSVLQVQLEGFPILKFTPLAEKLANELPENFDENLEPYQDFIKAFGTHFFIGGNLGGYLRHYFETSVKYYGNHDDSQLQAEASASFFRKINSHAAFNNTKSDVDTSFDSNTVDELLFYGGSLNVLDDKSVIDWANTVADKPWLFKGDLLPIYYMLEDKQKQDSMEKAVASYLNRAYFTDIQAQFYGYFLNHKLSNLTQTGKMLKEIDQILDGNSIDPDQAQKMKEDISFHWEIPPWWHKTLMCFQWFASGDRGQCGGGINHTVCSVVNSFTDAYLDSTDKRSEGCRMRWGIFSPDLFAQNALTNVQMCFKWYQAQPSRVARCGDIDEQVCVGLNEMTPYYYDGTSYGAECRMSWSLQLKDNGVTMPEWLMNTRICLEFTPQDYPDQCGLRDSDRVLCGRVGEWTPEYQDATDGPRRGRKGGKQGGCKMQWGIFNEFTP